MAKLFAIVDIVGGSPNTGSLRQGIDFKGYTCTGTGVAGFDACLFSGTAGQLVALNALSSVIGIVGVTEDGTTKWAELDGTISAGVRTKLNTWLTARGYPNIPVGWSYRQVVNAVFQRLNDRFDLSSFDIVDG